MERTQGIKYLRTLDRYGARSTARPEKYVYAGDYAIFDSEYIEFGEELIKAKALR